MRTPRKLFPQVSLLALLSLSSLSSLLAAACGGDAPPGARDGGTDGSEPGDDGGADGGTDAGEDGGADAGEDGGVSRGLIALSLEDAWAEDLSGVLVTPEAEPEAAVTSDEEGRASLEVGSVGSFLLRLEAESVLTTLVVAEATAEAPPPLDVIVPPADTFDALEDSIGARPDDSLALVALRFDAASIGGQSATLAGGTPYVLDAEGDLVAGSTLVAGGDVEVLFVDVPPGPIAPSVATENPDESCELAPLEPPAGGLVAEAGVATRLRVECRLTP